MAKCKCACNTVSSLNESSLYCSTCPNHISHLFQVTFYTRPMYMMLSRSLRLNGDIWSIFTSKLKYYKLLTITDDPNSRVMSDQDTNVAALSVQAMIPLLTITMIPLLTWTGHDVIEGLAPQPHVFYTWITSETTVCETTSQITCQSHVANDSRIQASDRPWNLSENSIFDNKSQQKLFSHVK